MTRRDEALIEPSKVPITAVSAVIQPFPCTQILQNLLLVTS